MNSTAFSGGVDCCDPDACAGRCARRDGQKPEVVQVFLELTREAGPAGRVGRLRFPDLADIVGIEEQESVLAGTRRDSGHREGFQPVATSVADHEARDLLPD